MIGAISVFFIHAANPMVKVCDVVIDDGCCANVVSQAMVENLGLMTIKHPHPYNLVWLKNSQKVNVYKQCHVQFSIGDIYYDKVLCDVIPMDACHLILGRPLQYDRHTMHDGKHNTYTFKKDGITITLAPINLNSRASSFSTGGG
jgi:hypothetical protein